MLSDFPPWPRSLPSSPPKHKPSTPDRMDNTKKPRHRHSPFQLAALNELYEKNEHPSLEQRTSLAEHLGMETKTVNSWFQNKRASSKKRHRGPPPQCELPPISTLIAAVSSSTALHPPSEFDELSEDERSSRTTHSSASEHNQQHSLFHPGNPQRKHLFDSDNAMPRKVRSRPSHAQTEELRKVYDIKPHPSKEEREELGRKIGMRYQSVTNWFQNQRSIAKKRKEEEEAQAALEAATSSKARTFTSYPPTAGASHPSLAVPPSSGHPSLPPLPRLPRIRRSASAAPAASRPTSPRTSPYRAAADRVLAATTHLRPRRTRPEPHQLEALKALFRRTETPSIEERGALSLEIGMEVGKVTNWFRNLRQTARRRARRGGSGDDDEDLDMDCDADDVSLATYNDSRSVSRAGTPLQSGTSSTSSTEDLPMLEDVSVKVKVEQGDKRRRLYAHATHAHSTSDMGSEEDDQEAVTPESSPPPRAYAPAASVIHRELRLAVDALNYAEMEKASAQFHTGVRVEDALLLLSFHHHVVR